MNPKSEIRNPKSSGRRPRVLAISSSGGHWIQMLRLRPAFEGCDVTYATTYADYERDVQGERFRAIVDANRTQKCKLLISALSILWVILTERPNIILSTGAAPGFFAIRVGKLLGKRTIWIDSIANAEELSLSGQKVGEHADLWLTQWEHLARPEGPLYYGNVLGEDGGQKADSREQKTGTIANPESVISNSQSEQKSFRIFVTVGSDVPFDRMVKVVDQWAASNPDIEVFAQIGRSSYKPLHIGACQFLAPGDFTARLDSSSLVIAHAGMGSILSALKHEKPILVMPRFGYLGETRNEHQVATVKRLAPMGLIEVAEDERALADRLPTLDALTNTNRLSPWASEGLTKEIGHFLRQA